jgi:hypothetical protein
MAVHDLEIASDDVDILPGLHRHDALMRGT